ncbi:GDP-D-glucose phosphorylase 1, partial [Halocaridina rubra]
MDTNGLDPSLEAIPIYRYTDEDFIYKTSSTRGQGNLSEFDNLLYLKWKAANDAGLFNYTTDGVETKVIPGKYKIVAQLNANRSKMRRKPEEIMSVNQPCDPTKFNFTKINSKEILAELQYYASTGK